MFGTLRHILPLVFSVVIAGGLKTALAAPFSVESAPSDERTVAVDWLEEVRAELTAQPLAGAETADARLVRRFVRGEGWQFLVQIQGIGTVEAARNLALRLVVLSGPSLVLEPVGGRDRIVDTVGKKPEPVSPQPAEDRASAIEGPFPPADVVIQSAVNNHGGVDGGAGLVGTAPSLSFVFDRKMVGASGPMRVHNRYFRDGDALRLEVYIREGSGKDSVTLVTQEGLGFVTAEGASVARDPVRVREVILRFAPQEVLRVPLGLAEDLATAGEWTGLRAEDLRVVDERRLVVLRPHPDFVPEPGSEGLVEALFYADPVTLAEMTWSTESGNMRFRFGDYRRLSESLFIPFWIEIAQDGVVVEEIAVHDLELAPSFPSELFASPTGISLSQ